MPHYLGNITFEQYHVYMFILAPFYVYIGNHVIEISLLKFMQLDSQNANTKHLDT